MASKSEQLQIRVTKAQKARLKRLAKASGQDVSAYVLSRSLPAEGARFAAILEKLRDEEERRYALAALSDLLASLTPGQFEEAVERGDLEGVSPFVENYVAAMVEHAAKEKGVAPPPWVGVIEPLERPHFATDLKNLRLHLLRSSFVPFKRRNIFVDSSVGARV